MRYICEPDIDRRKAGWGDHWWVIDTEKDEPKRRLFLMPEREAREWTDKMNGIKPPPQLSRTDNFLARLRKILTG